MKIRDCQEVVDEDLRLKVFDEDLMMSHGC